MHGSGSCARRLKRGRLSDRVVSSPRGHGWKVSPPMATTISKDGRLSLAMFACVPMAPERVSVFDNGGYVEGMAYSLGARYGLPLLGIGRF